MEQALTAVLLATVVAYSHGVPDTSEGITCMQGIDNITLTGMPYASCADECTARDWCTGVSYHVGARVCIVHGENTTMKSITHCEGFVYSNKTTRKEAAFCGNPKRNQPDKTCSPADGISKKQDCPVPLPSNDDMVLLGNQRHVGAKIAYKSRKSSPSRKIKTITCLPGGKWSGSRDDPDATTTPHTTTTPQATSTPEATTTPQATTTPDVTTTPETTTTPQATTTPDATTTSQATTTPETTTTPQATTTPDATTTSQATTTPDATTTSQETTTPQATTTPETTTTSQATTTPDATTTPQATTTRKATTTPETIPACPSGWIAENSSYYCILEELKTRQGAKDYCGKIGAYLVVPNDKEENEFIKSQLKGDYMYWIGFKRYTRWWWTTNREYLSTLNYVDWRYSEPQSHYCAIYKYGSTDMESWKYAWEGLSCNEEARVICEKFRLDLTSGGSRIFG